MSQVSTYLVAASSPTSQSEPPTPVDPTSTASSADKSPAEDAGHSICAHVEEKAKKKKDSMTRARRAQSWAQRRQQSDLRVEIPTTYQDFQHMSKGKCHSTFYFLNWCVIGSLLFLGIWLFCISWSCCGDSDFPMEGDDVEHLVKAGSESNCEDDASPIVRGSSTAVGTPQLSPRVGPTVRQPPSSDEGKIITHF